MTVSLRNREHCGGTSNVNDVFQAGWIILKSCFEKSWLTSIKQSVHEFSFLKFNTFSPLLLPLIYTRFDCTIGKRVQHPKRSSKLGVLFELQLCGQSNPYFRDTKPSIRHSLVWFGLVWYLNLIPTFSEEEYLWTVHGGYFLTKIII